MKPFLAFIGLSLLLAALSPVPGGCEGVPEATVASDQELSRMRGGFINHEGLQVSFGIERSVFLNGVLDTVSTINFSQGDGVAGDSLKADAVNTLKLIQTGSGNTFSPVTGAGPASPLGLTVIQNSLDNMVIKNATVINATVTSLGLFRSMHFNNLIQGQVLNSLR